MSDQHVREKPIIFSGTMIKSLLSGAKTQTRRIVKPQPPDWITEFGYTCFTPKRSISGRGYWKGVPGEEGPAEKFFKLPYQVGDRLWVREACKSYVMPHILTGEPTSNIGGLYVADNEPVVELPRRPLRAS